jgi:hypothetical protein
LTLAGLKSTVLAVDAFGTVTGISELELSSVKSSSVVSGKGTFDALHITSGAGKGMLQVGADGQVMHTSTVEASGLDISGDAVVGGKMTVNSLVWGGDVDKTSKSSAFLVVNKSTGEVTPQSTLTADKVVAAHVQSGVIEADEFKVTGRKTASLLAVSATGQVVGADEIAIPNMSMGGISVIGEGKFGSIKLEGITVGAPLTVDEAGKITASEKLSFQGFTAQDGSISTLTIQKDLILPSAAIASGEESAPLVADKNGKVSSSKSLKVSHASLATISVSGVAEFASLKLSSLNSAVLATDANGLIVGAEHIKMSGVEAVTVKASNLEAQRIKLTDIGAGLLKIDSSGEVSSVQGFYYDADTSAVVTKNLRLSELQAGFLVADKNGDVSSSLALNLPTLSAEHLTATSTLTTPKLVLNGPLSSLLSTDATGNVVAATSVKTDSVAAASLDISGKASVASLQISGLKTTVLFADATGNIVSAHDTSLGSIEADSISTASVKLKGVKETGVLVTDSTGAVKSSTHVEVKKVSTTDMSVTGDAIFNKLVTASLSLSSVKASSETAEVLVVDSKGNVAATSKLPKVSADTGEFKDITSKTVAASSFQFAADASSSLVDDALVTVDKRGFFKAASDVTISTLSVVSQLNVEGKISLGKLNMRYLKSVVLGTSASGDVVPVDGMTMASDGSLQLNAVKISALKGDISLLGNKLTDGVIVASKIKESDVFLNSKAAAAGAVAVVDIVSNNIII